MYSLDKSTWFLNLLLCFWFCIGQIGLCYLSITNQLFNLSGITQWNMFLVWSPIQGMWPFSVLRLCHLEQSPRLMQEGKREHGLGTLVLTCLRMIVYTYIPTWKLVSNPAAREAGKYSSPCARKRRECGSHRALSLPQTWNSS